MRRVSEDRRRGEPDPLDVAVAFEVGVRPDVLALMTGPHVVTAAVPRAHADVRELVTQVAAWLGTQDPGG